LTEDVKSALPSGPCRGGRRYIYIYIFIKYIYIYYICICLQTYLSR
jgi:hypothetical protein